MSIDKNIDKLFENARQSEPIISLEQIEEQIKVKGFRTPQKNKLINLKTTIIMSTLLSLLIGLFFIIPQTSEDTKTPIKSIANKKTAIESSIIKEPSIKLKQTKTRPHSKNLPMPNISMVNANKMRMSELPKVYIGEPKTLDHSDSSKFQKNELIDDSKPVDRSIDMKNIRLIELTNDELLKLGVQVIDKSIQVTTISKYSMKPFVTNYSKYGTSFNATIQRVSNSTDKEAEGGITFEINDPKNIETPDNKKIPKESSQINIEMKANPGQALGFSKISNASTEVSSSTSTYPDFSLITDDLGQLWRVYKVEDGLTDEDRAYMKEHRLNPDMYAKAIEGRAKGEKEMVAKLGGYIPILVKSGDVNLESDKAKKLWRADIIIWFEPSELLFSLLPERISKELKSEYQNIFVKKEVNGSSCKYFEACKNIPGAIESFQVYPNPTEDRLEMEFVLNNERLVSAGIYSVNGQMLKTVFRNQHYENGTNSFVSSIAELPQGVYLLVIESDKRDVITKRIIKK